MLERMTLWVSGGTSKLNSFKIHSESNKKKKKITSSSCVVFVPFWYGFGTKRKSRGNHGKLQVHVCFRGCFNLKLKSMQ